MAESGAKGALGTAGVVWPAEVFADLDDQSVKFVEELRIAGKRGFKHRANFFVAQAWMSESVALEDAAGVGVDNEDGMFAGVEKDGVGGLRADSAKGEQLVAKDVSRSARTCERGSRRALRKEIERST